MITYLTVTRWLSRSETRRWLLCWVVLVAGQTPALADNWQPMTGAETLRAFVAGATAEITLTPGVTDKLLRWVADTGRRAAHRRHSRSG